MRLPFVAIALLAACGPAVEDQPDARPSADAAADAAPRPDAPSGPDAEVPDYSKVYAHSGTELYRLDTTTLEPVDIGPFANLGTQSMTDIAIDKNDVMRGITLNKVFSIDVATGEATLLQPLAAGTPNFTSLSFVPADLNDPNSAEILVAAADDGTVYQIDVATGAATSIGAYGSTANGTIRSSGDIVAVRGLGIFATVTIGMDARDYLASIDPTDWSATPIGVGTVDYDKLFGLAYWRGTFYGFADLGNGNGGAIVTLDPTTGAASLVNQGSIRWYGAGVTTDAPIVN